MDIAEAVQQRKSIRAFKPDPVPQQVLRQILELALHAPSWANTQPWEFAIVGGEKLEEIRQAFLEKADDEFHPDLPGPGEFPEPYNRRRRGLVAKMAEIMQRDRQDRERLRQWQRQGLSLYGAPTAIYIYTDRSFCYQENSFNVWPIFDCGLVAENIMPLAMKYGLGTIPQMQAVHHPDILRNVLGIADSKLVVLGISIGYPDWDDPMNSTQSERDGLDAVASWYGFN
ncbi:nitroreductase [Chloroflexota bacterium]